MARPATGSARWNPKAKTWEARVSVGGKRVHVAVDVPQCVVTPNAPPKGCSCASCGQARRVAKIVSDDYRARGMVPEGTPHTVSEWFADYYKAAARGAVGRKNRGKPQTSVDARRSRFDTWIEPIIGITPMVNVTAAHLRSLVQKLDEQVLARTAFYIEQEDAPPTEDRKGRKPGLSAKTAASVWSEITSGFKEACHSKLDELRILDVNPAIGVLPPTTGENREQAALFPVEVLQLLSAADVPRVRRRTYLVALYTGCRRGEIARLSVGDVDLEHDIITVRGTKTNAAKRQIPIEPALRPLLAHLLAAHTADREARAAGGEDVGRVALFVVPRGDGKGGSSDLMKKDLERAKIDRADLSRDDASHMPFTFHGLRHTAVTHWAMAGKGQSWLQLVAGHTDTAMTMRYLDSAAVVRGRFGEPHPTMPAEVMAELLADLPVEFRSGFGIAVAEDKSKAANPSELAAILTVALRPQWELNPCSRRERPVS